MTTNPQQASSNPLLNLLDLVPSPLLLFSPDGRVAFSNKAAKTMACRPALSLPGDPNVRQMVQTIAKGNVLMQREITVEVNSDTGIEKLNCECAPKPIAGLVAMSVLPAPQDGDADSHGTEESASTAANGQGVPERLSLQQIMHLLRDDLMEPITEVVTAVGGEGSDIDPGKLPAIQASIQSLVDRLSRTADMIDVFGEDVLIGDERLVVPDLARQTCQALSRQAGEQNVRFMFEGESPDLPPVYGSKKLMLRALRESLQNALDHAHTAVTNRQEASAVRIAFSSSGQHLQINIRNLGSLSSAAIERHASTLFRPERPAAGTKEGDKEQEVSEKGRMRIGLPLTQRILQLHGGRLRAKEVGGEIDVALELPTGAPWRNNQHLDLLQAQIYAEDLSRLMARSRKRSAA
ncbi:ATP-binding protein [Hydrogenophaga sp. 5NK40-0174]|uniref:ATP-binding protein n=1 Tax=Hydrogenophaga sp. 5NK40-0174 TaxID=3127649 RepID=UPI0031073B0C